jgi:hypothetical protein
MKLRALGLGLTLVVFTGCAEAGSARTAPAPAAEASLAPGVLDGNTEFESFDDAIGGVPTGDAKANDAVPFDVIEPQGLGDPVGEFMTDPTTAAPADRVVEFDFDTPYGRVVIEEASPEVDPGGWQEYLDLLVKQNGSEDLHGSFGTQEVRAGQMALTTTSEDGQHTDIRWLENKSLEVYVRGPSLSPDACTKIAAGF